MTVLRSALPYDSQERQVLSRFWFPIARSVDLAQGPQPAMLLGQPLVLWRAGGGVCVAADRCCHRGVALHRGWIEKDALVCPYHGWHFDPQGQCLKVPAHPELRPSASLRIRTFPCLERHGLIWMCTGEPETAEPPPFPEAADPAFVCLLTEPTTVEASAGRQVEGFLDVGHFAWIHAESFARSDQPTVSHYDVVETERGLKFVYRSTVPNLAPGDAFPGAPDVIWTRHFELLAPFTARLCVDFPGGGRLCLLNATQPVAPDRCCFFTVVARDFDLNREPEEVHAFNQRIFAEDREIHQLQDPPFLPLDPGAECHVPSDRAALAYRRLLRSLGLQRA